MDSGKIDIQGTTDLLEKDRRQTVRIFLLTAVACMILYNLSLTLQIQIFRYETLGKILILPVDVAEPLALVGLSFLLFMKKVWPRILNTIVFGLGVLTFLLNLIGGIPGERAIPIRTVWEGLWVIFCVGGILILWVPDRVNKHYEALRSEHK